MSDIDDLEIRVRATLDKDEVIKGVKEIEGAFKGVGKDGGSELPALENLRVEQDKITEAAKRRGEAELKAARDATAAIERQIIALENRARLLGATSPAERGAAVRAQGQTVLSSLSSRGANPEQINRAASAYERLAQAAQSANIPLSQLNPVLGYQTTMLLRLGTSVANVAAGWSAATVVGAGFATGLAALGAGALFGANALGNYAREMKNVSEQTGLSLTGAQEFTRVADVMGVRAQALAPAINRLFAGLSEGGHQSEKASQAFALLGISARNAMTGALMPMDDLLPKIASALRNMKDEATADTVARELFGRGIVQLLPVLKEYEETVRKVRDTGVIIDPQTLENAERFHMQVAQLKDDWTALVHALEVKAVGVIEIARNIVTGGKGTEEQVSRDAAHQTLLNKYGINERQYQSFSPSQRSKFDALAPPPVTSPSTPFDAFDAASAQQGPYVDALLNRGRQARSQAEEALGTTPQQARLRKAEEDLKEALKKQNPDVYNPIVNADVASKTAAVNAARAAVKATQEYSAELRKTIDLEKQAKFLGLTGIEKVKAEYQEKASEITVPGLRSRAQGAAAQIIANAQTTEDNKIADSNVKKDFDTYKRSLEASLSVSDKLDDAKAKIADARRKLSETPEKGKKDFDVDSQEALDKYYLKMKELNAVYERQVQLAKSLHDDAAKAEMLRAASDARTSGRNAATAALAGKQVGIDTDEITSALERQKEFRDANRNISAQQIGAHVDEIRRRSSLAIATVAGNPNIDSYTQAKQEYDIRLQGEADVAAAQAKRIDMEVNAAKKRELAEQQLIESANARGQIELQYQERLIQLKREEEQKSRSVAGGLFDALTNPRGAGVGMQQLLRSQFIGMEKTMFENVVSPYVKAARESMSSTLPPELNGIFKGTPFENHTARAAGGNAGLDATQQKLAAIAASPVSAQAKAVTDNTTALMAVKETLDTTNQILSGGTSAPVTITGAGSTTTILAGPGASVTQGISPTALGDGSDLPLTSRGISNPVTGLSSGYSGGAPSWLQGNTLAQAALGFGGAAATTVGGLAAAGLFTPQGFSIPQKVPTISLADGGTPGAHSSAVKASGPGLNIPQAALASLSGALSVGTTFSKLFPQYASASSGSAYDGTSIPGIPSLASLDLGGSILGPGNFTPSAIVPNIPSPNYGASAFEGLNGFNPGGSGSGSDASAPFTPVPYAPADSNYSLAPHDVAGITDSLSSSNNSGSDITSAISALSSFGKGVKGFAGPNGASNFWQDITGNGTDSTATQVGTVAGGAATAVAGAFTVASDIKRGGAKGTLGAISTTAGTIAAFDPEPISKGILTAVALATGIAGSLLGDPKQQYQNKVNQFMQEDKYVAPPSLNETVGAGGYDINYNKYGRAREIPFQGLQSSTPFQIKDPYNSNSWLTVPGQVFQPGQAGGPISGGPAGSGGVAVSPGATYPSFSAAGGGNTTVNLTIHALDSSSIMSRSQDIGNAVLSELHKGGALSERVQATLLGS